MSFEQIQLNDLVHYPAALNFAKRPLTVIEKVDGSEMIRLQTDAGISIWACAEELHKAS